MIPTASSIMALPSSSFTTRRVNRSTFVVCESDLYRENPLIYVKIHPRAPFVIVTDTGCDEPAARHKQDTFTHLRDYLECYPNPANAGRPLNPGGERQYMIICTHCHFDHTGGITQFLEGGTTEIVASAAGRDFIESDLASHGLYKYVDKPAPYYVVSLWAQAFAQPVFVKDQKSYDLGITMLQTIGHTPDSLAWYDQDEMHLYVGDSFYREGEDGMPIVFPAEGDMREWIFAMQKLAVFTRTQNAREEAAASVQSEDGWVQVPRRVLVSCGHQTVGVDGAEILAELEAFSYRALLGQVPVVETKVRRGEVWDLWRETGEKRTPMSILAPRRLMRDCRRFFGHWVEDGR
ncbi:Metallo-beta-lactamase superfamily [Teratosphaeria destructans]|uniref:Metallo-beta-lactamase superfamily n=1 Tax=Teratosphaeria destructans TaxID=418781 RepID=A0A9W7SXQ0_9PEZI|nr:Metallo-beta-lactamase superfamily [Teratosphaeria destructans]